MGTLIYRVVNESDPPFSDPTLLDACIDPQFNGVFPDDPALGIVSERKANDTNNRTTEHPRLGENNEIQPDDSSPRRLR